MDHQLSCASASHGALECRDVVHPVTAQGASCTTHCKKRHRKDNDDAKHDLAHSGSLDHCHHSRPPG